MDPVCGDRAIAVVLRTQDPETGQQWVDLREEGVSLLPAGTVAQAPTAAFQGGLLAWGTRTKGRGRGRVPTSCSPQAGGDTPLPAGPAGEARTYLAAAQGWVYYTARQEAGRGRPCGQEPGHRGGGSLLERCNITGLVTDGTWCYCTNGSTTDCYRLTGTVAAVAHWGWFLGGERPLNQRGLRTLRVGGPKPPWGAQRFKFARDGGFCRRQVVLLTFAG